MTTQYRGRQLGFSLIELMIVIAIVGIFSVFSTPAFKNLIAANQLKSAGETYLSGIRLAQAEAISSGSQVQFFLSDDTPIAGANTSASGKNWGIQALNILDPSQVDELIQSATLASRYKRVKLESTDAAITFNSLGRVVSVVDNVVLDLSHPDTDKKFKIHVSTSGAMRLCDPDVSQTDRGDGC